MDGTQSGSLDVSDPYLLIAKRPSCFKNRKAVERKFVGGNTAIWTMSRLPVLTKEQMTKVTNEDREAVYKGVIASDKWGKKRKADAAGADGAAEPKAGDKDDDDDDSDDDDDAGEDAKGSEAGTPAILNLSEEVVMCWMELHPRVHT